MTDQEQIDVDRASSEMIRQFGRNAHQFAAKRAEEAKAAGDAERAQFWKWVEASVKPRASGENSD
jgi:hypothetical protein